MSPVLMFKLLRTSSVCLDFFELVVMLRGRVKCCGIESFNVRIKLGFCNVRGSCSFKMIDTAVTEEGMSGIEILLVERVVDTKNVPEIVSSLQRHGCSCLDSLGKCQPSSTAEGDTPTSTHVKHYMMLVQASCFPDERLLIWSRRMSSCRVGTRIKKQESRRAS